MIPAFHSHLRQLQKRQEQCGGEKKKKTNQKCCSKYYGHRPVSLVCGITTRQPLLPAPENPAARQLRDYFFHLWHFSSSAYNPSLSTLFFLNNIAIPFKTALCLLKTSKGWYRTTPNGSRLAAGWRLTVPSCR